MARRTVRAGRRRCIRALRRSLVAEADAARVAVDQYKVGGDQAWLEFLALRTEAVSQAAKLRQNIQTLKAFTEERRRAVVQARVDLETVIKAS